MDAFLANILSYPTVIFTVLAVFTFLYLIVASVGLAGFDDVDIEFESLAGLMTTLGLRGVPLSFAMGVFSLFAWAACALLTAYLPFGEAGGWFSYAVGTLLIPASMAISILITAQAVKPLRPLFRALNASAPEKVLLGATCVVRSTRVDEKFGEASVVIDGASLIIKVRAPAEKALKKGDKIVLIEHNKELNLYWSVPEHEFNG